MATVSLNSISKTYDQGVEAVKSVSLDVKNGEFLVLLGPSGCGKSTVLRMIAGLERVSEGEIKIGEALVTDLEPKDRDVAMVFQNYALYPHMTVAQNIGFGLELRGGKKQEIRKVVQETAELLDLVSELDRRPGELSGGQRQRVALGRAIVRNPSVFLFDEPLSNLDARLRATMRLEISKLHKRLKSTMIYVTHDQVEAMTMGQRIVVMEKGEILQVGEPLVVYNKPASIFVASFIGSPSINLVEAVASTNGPNQFDLVDLNCTVNAEDLLDTNTTIKSGTKVVVGIRPEALFIPSSEQQVYQKIVGKVEVVEPLGNETIVHIRVQETVLVARLPAQNLPTDGDQIEFSFDRKALSFFDSQSGKRL